MWQTWSESCVRLKRSLQTVLSSDNHHEETELVTAPFLPVPSEYRLWLRRNRLNRPVPLFPAPVVIFRAVFPRFYPGAVAPYQRKTNAYFLTGA